MIYHVRVDGEDIYNPEDDNLLLIDPTLELELNNAGSFDFTLPPSNRFYDRIKKMQTEISVYQDDELIFIGRAISDAPDFYNRKKVECEGALAYLNDTIQRPKKYTDLTPQQYLEKLIAIHNAQVSDDAFKQFKVGKVTVTDTESLYRYTNYNNTLTEIKEDLLDDFGGYLFIRVVNGVKYIDYLKELPYTCDQTISFGENLLDFTRNYDASQIATALIPLGADIQEDEENSESGETAETVDQSLVNRVTIESVNNGIDFIYSEEAVKTYGWIFKTQTWDGVNKPSVLLSKARQYLSDVQWESLVIEAKAVDLHFVDGSADRFRIGSTIRVQSEPHGMDTYLPLTKQTINLASIADNSITLGNDYTVPISAQSATLDRKQQKSAAQIAADIREAEASEKTARREAIENATALITGNAGGHVVFHYSTDSDGKIKNLEEILIMDTDQIETAKKVWRWNLAGLGYSNTGYNGDYTLAMTMDGAIVADKIITGILGDKAHKNFWNMETGEFSLSAYSTTEESEKYAKEQATAAQSAAEAKAKELADSASALANAAQKEADGKITTFYQTNEPSSEMSAGDLWIDTDDGNSLHRYNGKSWDDVQDVGISKAAQAASAAQSTADKKIVTYYQSSAPSDGDLSLGDLWFDSDDNNHLYRWNGSKWVESRDGYIEEAKQSAVETAATNTENAVSDYDTNLNQEKVFNKLTNNGKAKGIYMKDGELYINADLIKSGAINAIDIKGSVITGGEFSTAVGSNKEVISISKGVIKFIIDSVLVGEMYAAYKRGDASKRGVAIGTMKNGDFLALGKYAGTDNDGTTWFNNVISFYTEDIENGHTPFIANTVSSGTLYIPGSTSVDVENGLIKSWKYTSGKSQKIYIPCDDSSVDAYFEVEDGIISNWKNIPNAPYVINTLCGDNKTHKIYVGWSGRRLCFFVDNSNVFEVPNSRFSGDYNDGKGHTLYFDNGILTNIK